jgi:hypothetical protein
MGKIGEFDAALALYLIEFSGIMRTVYQAGMKSTVG